MLIAKEVLTFGSTLLLIATFCLWTDTLEDVKQRQCTVQTSRGETFGPAGTGSPRRGLGRLTGCCHDSYYADRSSGNVACIDRGLQRTHRKMQQLSGFA